MKLEMMTGDEFDARCAAGQVLERKAGRVRVLAERIGERTLVTKVWEAQDQRAFGRRRAPHLHFARICSGLAARGIAAPKVEAAGGVAARGIKWVRYEMLEGATLRNLMNGTAPLPQPEAIATFVCLLHDAGVYFRSLTPSNVLCLANGFGLIDVTDTRLHRRALRRTLRVRNLASFIAHPAELKRMLEGLGEAVVRAYATCAEFDADALWRDVCSDVERRRGRRARNRRRKGFEPLRVGEYPPDDD
jgi:tRNA A-37 threonylcarbamoyl transferase component Bud32